MRFLPLILSCAFITLGARLSGQKGIADISSNLNEVERLVLPAINGDSLRTASLAAQKNGKPLQFAQAFGVNVTPENYGNWTFLKNGMALWRLRIFSKDARSLNLGFSEFVLPEDAEFRLFDPGKKENLGPFLPAGNETHQQFWTPVITGDEIVLELYLPVAQRHRLKLRLNKINHDFLGFQQVLSGNCNLDVVCNAGDQWSIVDQYRDIIQSVGAYSLNGTIICTGFLVNNARQDCRPYFVSANHCGVNPGNAQSMVVYWNYQNGQCRQPNSPTSGQPGNGSLSTFNTGAVFKAGYAATDFVLVELDDPVNPGADAFFTGWNAGNEPPTDTLICIHHPNNEEKRISFSFSDAFPGFWGDDQPSSEGNHLIIPHWDIGTTQGGSSGAPLFNKTGRFVGQLHGGLAACGNQGYDSFGWLFYSWQGGNTPSSSLKSWLDPDNTGISELTGKYQSDCNAFVGISASAQALCAGDSLLISVSLGQAFGSATSILFTGLPSGLSALLPDGPFAGGEMVSVLLTGTEALHPGQYLLTIYANDGNQEATGFFNLQFERQIPETPQWIWPPDGLTNADVTQKLIWSNSDAAMSFEWQVATDSFFIQLVDAAAGIPDTFSRQITLLSETGYYARVRAANICGLGPWSEVHFFVTGNFSCLEKQAADTPILISESDENVVVESRIMMETDGLIGHISMTELDIEHSWVGDLSAELIAPDGTAIALFDRLGIPGDDFGCDGADIRISLNDTGADPAQLESACNGFPPAASGTFQPLDPFSALNGKPAAGAWTLRLRDHAENDGGKLLAWSLALCTIPAATKTREFLDHEVRLFPNPASQSIHIRVDRTFPGDCQVEIADPMGKFLLGAVLQKGQSQTTLELASLPSGIYWVILKGAEGRKAWKFIKI